MKLRQAALYGAILFCLTTSLAFSQAVKGTLLGTVTDSSGSTAPNAKVTITDANTALTRNTLTNESGNYIFPDLPPGVYTVVAELAGFKRSSRPGVEVQVNSSPRVDIVLQTGSVSESIEVTAETPLL